MSVTHSYKVDPKHQEAFDAMVERISDNTPNSGWNETSQLPRLDAKAYATILRAHPDAFDDMRPEELDVADALETGGTGAASEAIALPILMMLQAHLRNRLLKALQKQEGTDDEGRDVDEAYLEFIGGAL